VDSTARLELLKLEINVVSNLSLTRRTAGFLPDFRPATTTTFQTHDHFPISFYDNLCEISGSHGGEYEDDCLLGCFAV
jgi:hypothetical protein